MKEKIFEYIKSHPGTSFAELSHSIEGFKGDRMLTRAETPNVIYWSGLSSGACDAIGELIREGRVELDPADILTYMMDGEVLQYPIYKRVGYNYKTPHWLPVVLNLTKKVNKK